MTTDERTSKLAERFEQQNNALIEIVAASTDEEWQRTTEAEQWTVAATTHHLAIIQQAFVGIVELFASGETYSPTMDMEEVHKGNAEHAVEFAAADKLETLSILEASGERMAQLVRSFDSDGLDRLAGNFGGNEMTVAQFVDFVVIGHAREHQESIGATVSG